MVFIEEAAEFLSNCVVEGYTRMQALEFLQKHHDHIQKVLDDFHDNEGVDEGYFKWKFSRDGYIEAPRVMTDYLAAMQVTDALSILYCIQLKNVNIKSPYEDGKCNEAIHVSQLVFPPDEEDPDQPKDLPICPWWGLPLEDRLDHFMDLYMAIDSPDYFLNTSEEEEAPEEENEDYCDVKPHRLYLTNLFDFTCVSMHYRTPLGILPNLFKMMARFYDSLPLNEDLDLLHLNTNQIMAQAQYLSNLELGELGGDMGHPFASGYYSWYYTKWVMLKSFDIPEDASALADLGWATFWHVDFLQHMVDSPVPNLEGDDDDIDLDESDFDDYEYEEDLHEPREVFGDFEMVGFEKFDSELHMVKSTFMLTKAVLLPPFPDNPENNRIEQVWMTYEGPYSKRVALVNDIKKQYEPRLVKMVGSLESLSKIPVTTEVAIVVVESLPKTAVHTAVDLTFLVRNIFAKATQNKNGLVFVIILNDDLDELPDPYKNRLTIRLYGSKTSDDPIFEKFTDDDLKLLGENTLLSYVPERDRPGETEDCPSRGVIVFGAPLKPEDHMTTEEMADHVPEMTTEPRIRRVRLLTPMEKAQAEALGCTDDDIVFIMDGKMEKVVGSPSDFIKSRLLHLKDNTEPPKLFPPFELRDDGNTHIKFLWVVYDDETLGNFPTRLITTYRDQRVSLLAGPLGTIETADKGADIVSLSLTEAPTFQTPYPSDVMGTLAKLFETGTGQDRGFLYVWVPRSMQETLSKGYQEVCKYDLNKKLEETDEEGDDGEADKR